MRYQYEQQTVHVINEVNQQMTKLDLDFNPKTGQIIPLGNVHDLQKVGDTLDIQVIHNPVEDRGVAESAQGSILSEIVSSNGSLPVEKTSPAQGSTKIGVTAVDPHEGMRHGYISDSMIMVAEEVVVTETVEQDKGDVQEVVMETREKEENEEAKVQVTFSHVNMPVIVGNNTEVGWNDTSGFTALSGDNISLDKGNNMQQLTMLRSAQTNTPYHTPVIVDKSTNMQTTLIPNINTLENNLETSNEGFVNQTGASSPYILSHTANIVNQLIPNQLRTPLIKDFRGQQDTKSGVALTREDWKGSVPSVHQGAPIKGRRQKRLSGNKSSKKVGKGLQIAPATKQHIKSGHIQVSAAGRQTEVSLLSRQMKAYPGGEQMRSVMVLPPAISSVTVMPPLGPLTRITPTPTAAKTTVNIQVNK